MKYLTQYLQRYQPSLLLVLEEAKHVTSSNYRLRFNFAALALREMVRVCYQSHNAGRGKEAAQTARRDFKWLPEKSFRKKEERNKNGSNEVEYLTRRGELLLSVYKDRNPSQFSQNDQTKVINLIAELETADDRLNTLVHSLPLKELNEEAGKHLLNDVLQTADEVFAFRLQVLDIVNGGSYSDTASLGSEIVGGSYRYVGKEKNE